MAVRIITMHKDYTFWVPKSIDEKDFNKIKSVCKKKSEIDIEPAFSLKDVFPVTFYFLAFLSFLTIYSIIFFLLPKEIRDEYNYLFIPAAFCIFIIFGILLDLFMGNSRSSWHSLYSYYQLKKDVKHFCSNLELISKKSSNYQEFEMHYFNTFSQIPKGINTNIIINLYSIIQDNIRQL